MNRNHTQIATSQGKSKTVIALLQGCFEVAVAQPNLSHKNAITVNLLHVPTTTFLHGYFSCSTNLPVYSLLFFLHRIVRK